MRSPWPSPRRATPPPPSATSSGAGVSRKTFYEHFADKEECFWPPGTPVCRWYSTRSGPRTSRRPTPSAACARACARISRRSPPSRRSRARSSSRWSRRARTPRRRAEVHARFADLFATMHDQARREMPQFPDVPPHIPRAAVGAINELVSDYVRAGRTEQLPELEETILYLELVLFGPRRRRAGDRPLSARGVLLLWDIDGTLIRASLRRTSGRCSPRCSRSTASRSRRTRTRSARWCRTARPTARSCARCSSRAGSPAGCRRRLPGVRAHRLRTPLRLALRGAGRR